MSTPRSTLLLIAAAHLLAACGAVDTSAVVGSRGTGADSFSCYPVGVDGATLSTFCLNCRMGAFTDRPNSVDADLDTYASLSLYHPDDLAAQVSQMSVEATSNAGSFSAGSRAGVVVGLPAGTVANYSLAAATYLDGIPQEAYSPTPVHVGPGTSDLVFIGFDDSHPTTKDFDAVELQLVELAPWLEAHTFRLHEFCADGAAN